VLIYACISSHGFGHGSRTAAVLGELAVLRPHWRLVLSTALPGSFLELAFGPVAFERRSCRWDVGVIQADALQVDPQATLVALEQLERELPERIEAEAAWLAAQSEPVLVLADVPPAAALLAARIGAPLVWLASFGWDAIHGAMGGAFLPWAERHRQLYGRGELLIRCPLSLPMPWGVPVLDVGVTTSRPRLDPVDLARRLDLPSERDRCVLISFGGLGMALDPALLARWPGHVFVSPEPSLAELPNGRVLPAGVRPLDLMPLAGRLITKPGYSSFCEAFGQGVGIHLVHREGFAEAAVLEEALQRHGWHRLLSQAQLHSGDWELDQPLLPPREGPLALDGAALAAAALVGQGEGRSAVPIVEPLKV
jgi:hypothetical protein